MSVIFPSAILRPEMATPILWAPGISVFFLQENLHVHKKGGGVILGLGGGVPISFLWARGFFWQENATHPKKHPPK